MENESKFSLKNKSVLITGGAGFLGTYFVHALSSAGAPVAIAEIGGALAAAQELAKVISGQGGKAVAVEMDVTDPPSVEKGFSEGIKALGKIDVLVNNAAIDPKFDPGADLNAKLFENYPTELLKKSLDVNVLGYVLVAQQAVRHMRGKGGVIINVSSIYGLVGPDQGIYPDGTQKPVDYAVTKGAVNMLTKWLATTYGKHNIRANTYTLGGVFKGHSGDFLKNYSARTPLGRMVDPKEVGAPIVFLASDASSGMTGANLIVDGGWTAW